MTPERQKWWDSLPKEERLVRLAIKKEKQYLSLYKSEAASTVNIWDFIKYQKLLIKALRKQIAMDVIALHNSAYEYYTCPYCRQNVKEGDVMRDEDNYCASCGQKLRWEE